MDPIGYQMKFRREADAKENWCDVSKGWAERVLREGNGHYEVRGLYSAQQVQQMILAERTECALVCERRSQSWAQSALQMEPAACARALATTILDREPPRVA